MTALYRHPAEGYALLWPRVDLGRDYAVAAACASVGSAAIAKGALPLWAVADARGHAARLPVQTHRDARRAVATFKVSDVTLYQGCRLRADGRTLWRAVERFSRVPSETLLGPDGLVLKAKNDDPLREGEFKGYVRRTSDRLADADYAAGHAAVGRFVDRVADVDPAKGLGAFDADLRAASRDLKADQRDLNRAWVKAAGPEFKGLARDTKRSVKERYLGGVGLDLSAPQVDAVERLVEQQGWFVRGMDGQRNDALTARARKIVAQGLVQGLGRAQIADDLRKQLPDMWQGMGRNYAHVVAANGLSRARSHAELSSYGEMGIEYAEVVAMLDERTTDICRLMDGQIVPVQGSLAIANNAARVKTPEDVGQVAPFLREVRNDQGQLDIKARGKVLGTFERTARGRVDDRGRAQQFTAGAGFNDANVGAPPYHHNCRTTLIPRADLAQVPQGFAARAQGPHPSGAGEPGAYGVIEQFPMPTLGKPVITGSSAPVDDYQLPTWKDPTARQLGTVATDPTKVAVRIMPADQEGRSFYWTQPWETTDAAVLATPGGALRNARDAVLHAVYSGSPRTMAGLMLANPANVGRDQLLQVRDGKGGVMWARLTGTRTKEMEAAADAVRLAATPAEAAKAADALVVLALRAGAIKLGKRVEDVASAATKRITTGTSGIEAVNPTRTVNRPQAAQPQAGTKPGAGPSPIREEPAKKPFTGALRNVEAGAELYSARPDGASLAKVHWNKAPGVWSSTAVDANGVPRAPRTWNAVSQQGERGISKIRPAADDHVVNVHATYPLDPRSMNSRNFIAGALNSERSAKFGGTRDWVFNSPQGHTMFLRIDGAKLKRLKKAEYEEAYESWVRSGNTVAMAKLGIEVETDVRKFYPNARIDWTQRNLIAGVPVAEQVDKRIAAVTDEVQQRIRAEEARKGRALTSVEKGQLIIGIANASASTTKASDILVSRTKSATAEEKARIKERDFQGAIGKKIKGTPELMDDGPEYDAVINFAFRKYSEPMLQAIAALGAPRIYKTTGATRAFYYNNGDTDGKWARGGMIVMDVDAYDVVRMKTKNNKWDRQVLVHEAGHHAVQAGLTDVAARIVRNRQATDVSTLRQGDIQLQGRGYRKDEVAVPGKFVDPYDGKVYGNEADSLRARVGKPLKAKDMRHEDTVDVYDTQRNQEFFSMGIMRLNDPTDAGLNWEKTPEQIAFLISALRGHYVPH